MKSMDELAEISAEKWKDLSQERKKEIFENLTDELAHQNYLENYQDAHFIELVLFHLAKYL